VVIGLFRLFFYAIIAYLIYKFVALALMPRQQRGTRPPAQGRSGVMVKDEICNTYLPKEDAVARTIDGREHFFCSRECLRKFDEQKKRGA
jgi:YHS domain-containing protein